MTPDERAAGLSTADLGEWPKVPADPDPMPDHEDAISWHEVCGLLQVGAIVVLSIAAIAAVGAITGAML